MSARRRLAALAVAAPLALVAAAPAQSWAAPTIEQMVVFRGGKADQTRAPSGAVEVKVGRRRCAVAGSTPLAALWRRKPARLRLRDFASCSSRPRDAGQLYVARIGGQGERGAGGWVYKVGRREASAGAGDPTGPFGRGRLKRGQRVLWFFCRVAGDCQRTLELRSRVELGGAVTFTVVGYDSQGKGVRVAGARVKAGSASVVTGADGTVRTTLAPGRYKIHSSKKGLVRSFTESLVVR